MYIFHAHTHMCIHHVPSWYMKQYVTCHMSHNIHECYMWVKELVTLSPALAPLPPSIGRSPPSPSSRRSPAAPAARAAWRCAAGRTPPAPLVLHLHLLVLFLEFSFFLFVVFFFTKRDSLGLDKHSQNELLIYDEGQRPESAEKLQVVASNVMEMDPILAQRFNAF